jgi:DNA-binding IclR family transcriptional regulator
MTRTSIYSLLTLEKGLRVLELVADNAGDIGLTQLSEQLDESVIFRILRTLVGLGYLNQDPHTKRYSLGFRVSELGGRRWRGCERIQFMPKPAYEENTILVVDVSLVGR